MLKQDTAFKQKAKLTVQNSSTETKQNSKKRMKKGSTTYNMSELTANKKLEEKLSKIHSNAVDDTPQLDEYADVERRRKEHLADNEKLKAMREPKKQPAEISKIENLKNISKKERKIVQ